MSDYKSEDEREAFDVKSASREEIEAYIGDLRVEIERLQRPAGSRSPSWPLQNKPPGHLAHAVDPE